MAEERRDWDERYRTGTTPWDSGQPSRELVRTLAEAGIGPGRAIEFGCGTGTNAVHLAQQGFDVTAIDLSSVAVERARSKAEAAGVAIRFLVGDVVALPDDLGPFDFLLDRGCWHCVRGFAGTEYLATAERVLRPGATALILAGNANERTETGPPRVTEDEIRRELGSRFDLVRLRDFRFEDPGGAEGPLGWSILLRRRDAAKRPVAEESTG